jgi:hypothetical protein
MARSGLMRFRAHYGVTGHHQLGNRRGAFLLGVTMGSLRVQTYDVATQDQLWREDIILVDERRWHSVIKNAQYRQALQHYHQWFVRSGELQVDDLVLWPMLSREGANKLSPGWEGPFRVTQVYRLGCVCLATEDGEPLSNPWNIEHLHKFYP